MRVSQNSITEPRTVEAVNKFENLVILEWHSITEPRAVATGCKHSTNLITSLMNQLSLDPIVTTTPSRAARLGPRSARGSVIGWHSRVQRTVQFIHSFVATGCCTQRTYHGD